MKGARSNANEPPGGLSFLVQFHHRNVPCYAMPIISLMDGETSG